MIALESDEEDVAYGTSRLALHQDEIYYDATPGISFLHCIRYMLLVYKLSLSLHFILLCTGMMSV